MQHNLRVLESLDWENGWAQYKLISHFFLHPCCYSLWKHALWHRRSIIFWRLHRMQIMILVTQRIQSEYPNQLLSAKPSDTKGHKNQRPTLPYALPSFRAQSQCDANFCSSLPSCALISVHKALQGYWILKDPGGLSLGLDLLVEAVLTWPSPGLIAPGGAGPNCFLNSFRTG